MKITAFIICMTKLLDADWLRSLQLNNNDFAKTNKMAESHLTKEIAPEEHLKQKANEQKHQILV